MIRICRLRLRLRLGYFPRALTCPRQDAEPEAQPEVKHVQTGRFWRSVGEMTHCYGHPRASAGTHGPQMPAGAHGPV